MPQGPRGSPNSPWDPGTREGASPTIQRSEVPNPERLQQALGVLATNFLQLQIAPSPQGCSRQMVITVLTSDTSTLRYTRQSNETGFPRVEIFSRKMEKKGGGSGTFSKAGNGTDQEAERPQPPSSANLEFSVPNKCFISPSISSLLTFSLVNQQLLLSDFLKPLPHFRRGLKKTFSLLLFIVLWGGFS